MAKYNNKGLVLLDELISEYNQEENEILFDCMSKAMKKAKKDLKAASPKGPNGYANGWSIRTKRERYGFTGILYNKTAPRLTHLLERSHVIKNQYGEYGRTSPGHGQVVHIEPVRDAAEEYLIQLLVEAHEQV